MPARASNRVVLGVFLALGGGPAPADTIQGFDTPGTPFELGQHANPPPAEILPGGPDGNFLRLAANTADPPNINTLDFARTHLGPACQIDAAFDFRITPGSGRADGLGLALLDTGVYGRQGVVAPPQPLFVPEEPGFERSLGIGFDVYQNPEPPDLGDNHVSIHFDGQLLTQVDAVVDLAGGELIHAEISVGLAGSTVSVTLTPAAGSPVAVLTAFPVPGLRPYESRVHLGGRSGGLAADHDIDNVSVTFGDCPPELVGRWSGVMDWPVVAIHAHLLPTSKVLFWDRHDLEDGDPHGQQQQAAATHAPGGPKGDTLPRLWDPATGQVTFAAPPVDYDLFCSGHALLAEGQLHVAGGHILDNVGLRSAALYDPFEDRWTALPPMRDGRWYPTNTVLADGDVLVVSGDIDKEQGVNTLPEVWQAGVNTWRALPTAHLALPLYPSMFLMPDGRVFYAGPEAHTRLLDTSGTGAWESVASSSFGDRNYGSSVLYDDGKVLLVGGGLAPTASAETIDLGAPAPAWTATGSMAFRRRQLNATLLPDGKVLATGGTSAAGFNNSTGAVHAAELWDPATGEWSLLAAMVETRIYHSIALLLPDGRILSAGGGHPSDTANGDPDHFNAEVYSPPYLFRGPRPVIDAAPDEVLYGETFAVSTPDAASIDSVHWLRLGSVTHAFDQNQRINRLGFAPAAGGLEVTAPSDPRLCPPGHYMLFLISADGVPSVAKILRIHDGAMRIFGDGFESGDTSAWSS